MSQINEQLDDSVALPLLNKLKHYKYKTTSVELAAQLVTSLRQFY